MADHDGMPLTSVEVVADVGRQLNAQEAHQFRPTRPWVGVWLFLTSKRRYLEAAVEHAAWLSLRAPDLQARYREGNFDPCSVDTEALELRRFEELRRQLRRSFGQSSLTAVFALLTCARLGAVRPDLPVHVGHSLGVASGFLIAWAALFELGGPGIASWDGETLSETVHPKIFQLLFIPGTFVLLCSVLL